MSMAEAALRLKIYIYGYFWAISVQSIKLGVRAQRSSLNFVSLDLEAGLSQFVQDPRALIELNMSCLLACTPYSPGSVIYTQYNLEPDDTRLIGLINCGRIF
jgi:hypothetical protein